MKRIFYFVSVFLSLFAMGCGNNAAQNGNDDTTKTANVDTSKTAQPKQLVAYDAALTDLANFIAGADVTSDSTLSRLQKKDYYKNYLDFVRTTWDSTETKRLQPIKGWSNENGISTAADTGTVFYPFSGPDFLFANTFFPQGSNYIMVALEKPGTLPNFNNMADAEVSKYFKNMEQSQRYLNKAGYFVTQHMGSDFYNQSFDGVVHMIFYFLGRTKHYVSGVRTVYFDQSGVEHDATSDADLKQPITAMRIDFTDSLRSRARRIYYMSVDVSDKNLATVPHFLAFVKNMKPNATYMKAASCILFNPTFVKLRDFILDNTNKILQDDTGIPFKNFDNKKFDLQLFGVYTRTINDLNWCFQPDLRKATEQSKPLPFKISYIGFFNEGILMYAKRK